MFSSREHQSQVSGRRPVVLLGVRVTEGELGGGRGMGGRAQTSLDEAVAHVTPMRLIKRLGALHHHHHPHHHSHMRSERVAYL